MYRVLVVEDDPMVAMIHNQFLAQNPAFQIAETCGDGLSALKYVEKNDVDLVILDVHMPHVSGLELLHQLRDRNYPLEVIMVTAANDVATLEETFRLGVVDFLVKPFTNERFQAALQKFIDKRGSLAGVTALDQENIDKFLGDVPKPVESSPSPKGIQEKTVEIIVEYLKSSDQEWHTGDEIAAAVKLSSVTIRRYMNYLAKIDVVDGQMDYETGGRPKLRFRLKK